MISNINVGSELAARDNGDILYQTFDNMARHFGRNMKLHRHDGFYQMFFIVEGRLSLLQSHGQYSEFPAPLFVIFPPSIPHAFVTPRDTHGHAVTVRGTLIDPLLGALLPNGGDLIRHASNLHPLAGQPQELQALHCYFELIAHESGLNYPGRRLSLESLTKALFIFLFRCSGHANFHHDPLKSDFKLFVRFNSLITAHYSQHWHIERYAEILGISLTRLKNLCCQYAGKSPKRLIAEKIQTEAENLLRFTDYPVGYIADQLGFMDASYFARFFARMAHTSPSRWRQAHTLVTYL